MTPPIKKTKQTETKVRLEHLSIVHQGVRVDIVVNYTEMEVSLTNPDRSKKNWQFCERSLAYKNGWYTILEAMKIAMELGFKKLEERLANDSKFTAEKIIKMGL